MTLHTAIDLISTGIIIAQAIAYERLRRQHLETVAALWASSLDK